MPVRRSTASTSVSRAGTSGLPARSVRRKTIPCPAGAGRNVASVATPVCNPVPRSAADRVTERLAVGGTSGALRRGGRVFGFGLHQVFELAHDLREPIHCHLRAQVLAVRACWIPKHGRPRGGGG